MYSDEFAQEEQTADGNDDDSEMDMISKRKPFGFGLYRLLVHGRRIQVWDQFNDDGNLVYRQFWRPSAWFEFKELLYEGSSYSEENLSWWRKLPTLRIRPTAGDPGVSKMKIPFWQRWLFFGWFRETRLVRKGDTWSFVIETKWRMPSWPPWRSNILDDQSDIIIRSSRSSTSSGIDTAPRRLFPSLPNLFWRKTQLLVDDSASGTSVASGSLRLPRRAARRRHVGHSGRSATRDSGEEEEEEASAMRQLPWRHFPWFKFKNERQEASVNVNQSKWSGRFRFSLFSAKSAPEIQAGTEASSRHNTSISSVSEAEEGSESRMSLFSRLAQGWRWISGRNGRLIGDEESGREGRESQESSER